jgi:hypothetical protein
MIHAQQMQDTMQHKDADFILSRVPPFACLGARPLHGYSDVPEKICILSLRKGQNVSGVIFAEKLRVQSAEFGVIGDAAMEIAAARYAIAQHLGKGLQAFIVQRGRLSPVSYQWVGLHDVPPPSQALMPEPERMTPNPP